MQYLFYENWHHFEKNIRFCEDTNCFVYLEHSLKDFDDQLLFSFVFFHICFIILLLIWNQLMKSLSRTRMWRCSRDRFICHQIICYWLWARILDWKMITSRNESSRNRLKWVGFMFRFEIDPNRKSRIRTIQFRFGSVSTHFKLSRNQQKRYKDCLENA